MLVANVLNAQPIPWNTTRSDENRSENSSSTNQIPPDQKRQRFLGISKIVRYVSNSPFNTKITREQTEMVELNRIDSNTLSAKTFVVEENVEETPVTNQFLQPIDATIDTRMSDQYLNVSPTRLSRRRVSFADEVTGSDQEIQNGKVFS